MAQQHYADFHFHTECSPDSIELLENHILAAASRGIHEICVTDHWDLVDEEYPTFHPDIPKWHEIFTHCLANKLPQTPKDFKLNFGIETGEGFANLPCTEKILARGPFDFVLGSVHSINVKNQDVSEGENGLAINNGIGKGIYFGIADSNTPEKLNQFFLDYFDSLILHSTHCYFDSLSHIIYPFRYLKPTDDIHLENYMEQITAVLENLIKNQKSMEFNTTHGDTIELWIPILKRYKEQNGKLLTIGSDAHRQAHIGLGVKEAVSLLKSMGFTSYTTYTKRNPVEVPIL